MTWVWWGYLALQAWCSSAYHVLVVFPVPSRSHHALGTGIVDALLHAGHQVTWATPYPPREKRAGLNTIDLSANIPILEDIDWADTINSGLLFVRSLSWNISRSTLENPVLRDAIVKSRFDAVLTEPFFSESDFGYAAVLQIPWIAFMSTSMQPYLEQQVDEARHLATVPMLMNHATIPMGFWRRMFNTLIHVAMTIERWVNHLIVKSFYESEFGPLAAARGVTLPQFYDAYYNISIVLVNSHPVLAPAKSLPPNVIEIGGFHFKSDTPPLPQDLQELMDSSPQGVVYFSMGSVIKSVNLPAATKQQLLRVLGELPYTVLWKFEEQLDDIPKNVHIRPWMPQTSILSHPHTKLFISHCGALSVAEAVHHAVPLLAAPVYGDQGSNAVHAAHLGLARTIRYDHNMAASLRTELHEMMSNDSYAKRVKHISKLFRKRPVEPRKLIAHYVEVAIESQGAYHLRSKSQLYAWYQRWMLDQLAALLLLLALLYGAVRALLRICYNRICNNTVFNKNKTSYICFNLPRPTVSIKDYFIFPAKRQCKCTVVFRFETHCS